jgi:hypothetical protein
MRHRGVGGTLCILSLVGSVIACAQSGLLYVNEEPIVFLHPVIQQETSLLVPLEEMGPLIGLEILESDGSTVLRGAGYRQAVDEQLLHVEDGVAYVSLEWICGLVAGDLHRLGGDVYVRTRRQEMTDVEASAERVTVRFTGFSPHTVSRSRQGQSEVLVFQWAHSVLGVPGQLVRVGESGIRDVQVTADGAGVRMTIKMEPDTILATEQCETGESYRLTLCVSDRASNESLIELDDGRSVYEWHDADGSRFLDYVYVESWRSRFRLAPMASDAGYQALGTLGGMMSSHAAAAAASVDCAAASVSAACLIMDGIPYSVPDTPSEVLAIDLFGRWTTFSSLCTVSVKHAGRLLPVDGVNRPLGYGEVVSYVPGYAGNIARAIPGSFLAVKIRENRVVSVYQGPYVAADASALLVVASGDAKTKLSSIELGDPIELAYQFPNASGTYRHAFSAGPRMMTDGVVNDGEPAPGLRGGIVLAGDWQGGLYLVRFGTDGEPYWRWRDILASLPTALKDAALLSACNDNAIGYSSAHGTFQLGSQEPIRLTLGLIPLAP